MEVRDPFELAATAHAKACKDLFQPCPDLSKARTVIKDALVSDHGYGQCVVRLRDSKGNFVATYLITDHPPAVSRVYNAQELEQLKPTLQKARELWRKRVVEFEASRRHSGTCVLGAGIETYTLLKRERIPKRRLIIRAPLQLQGSLSWEESLEEILRFLRSNGIDCDYKSGCMD